MLPKYEAPAKPYSFSDLVINDIDPVFREPQTQQRYVEAIAEMKERFASVADRLKIELVCARDVTCEFIFIFLAARRS